jgi:phosphatidylethanolamine/phosphatidyl-N-methylethanolamine N-methyltransferase
MKKYLENSAVLLFLQRMVVSPKSIGAVLPSSKRLAIYMAKEALKSFDHSEDYILEVGAGTGRMTRALLDLGLSPQKLLCVELDLKLHNYMAQKFSMVTTIQGNATNLATLIDREKQGKISTIISGIPMRNLSAIEQNLLVQAYLSVLKPMGSILQFTYGGISPFSVPGLKGEKLARIYCNLPPATVWAYQKIW